MVWGLNLYLLSGLLLCGTLIHVDMVLSSHVQLSSVRGAAKIKINGNYFLLSDPTIGIRFENVEAVCKDFHPFVQVFKPMTNEEVYVLLDVFKTIGFRSLFRYWMESYIEGGKRHWLEEPVDNTLLPVMSSEQNQCTYTTSLAWVDKRIFEISCTSRILVICRILDEEFPVTVPKLRYPLTQLAWYPSFYKANHLITPTPQPPHLASSTGHSVHVTASTNNVPTGMLTVKTTNIMADSEQVEQTPTLIIQHSSSSSMSPPTLSAGSGPSPSPTNNTTLSLVTGLDDKKESYSGGIKNDVSSGLWQEVEKTQTLFIGQSELSPWMSEIILLSEWELDQLMTSSVTSELLSTSSSISLSTATPKETSTERATTSNSSADETTTERNPACFCQCRSPQIKIDILNMTEKAMEELTASIKKNLTVDKSSLSATIRKKTSAADSRQSSKLTGIIGVFFLSSTFGLFFVMDFVNLTAYLGKVICVKIKSLKSYM